MNKYKEATFAILFVLFVALVSGSCSFSVKPVYNSKNEPAKQANSAQIKDINNREDLKIKAAETVKQLHKLMDEGKFEEVYQMVDERSPHKNPKAEAISNFQELTDALGKFEGMELTKDKVVEEQGQLQVRQEFIVKFEKDTPTPKRYEIFIWNVYPGDNFKLQKYLNAKGED